jgi:hypothetical protein
VIFPGRLGIEGCAHPSAYDGRMRALAITILLFGCGGEQTDPGTPCGAEGACPAGWVCIDDLCVPQDPCADVDCPTGEICDAGDCVDDPDGDGDGYDDVVDCDDADPEVIPGSTRDCSTECGNGTEVCLDAAWQNCSAPAPPCDCSDGETLDEPCALCGTSSRACVDGVWATEPGPCEEQGECEAGVVVEEPCGDCGTATRECDEHCAWMSAECVGSGYVDERCPAERRVCGLDGICVVPVG